MIALAEIREFGAKRRAERAPLEVPAWGLTGDRAVRFRRMDADTYYGLRERAKADQVDVPDGDESPRSIAYFVEMVAATAVSADGTLIFDSDEGRAFLRDPEETPFPLLVRLTDEAIEVNGLGESKGG